MYIDYLQSNDPITPAEFEEIWNGLEKDIIKVREALSSDLQDLIFMVEYQNTPEIYAAEQDPEIVDLLRLSCPPSTPGTWSLVL